MTLVDDFLIFGSITLLLYYCYEIYKNNERLSHIPGPLPIPFFGIKLPTNIYEITTFFDNLTNKYGRTFKYYLGTQLTVATYDADLIQAILQNTVHLQKSTVYDLTRPWLRDGLIVSYGKKWSQRRKLLNPTFHTSILKNFFSTFKESSEIIVSRLQQEVDKGNTVNAIDFLAKWSLDVAGETTFGIKLDIQKGANKAYIDAINFMVELVHIRNFSLWKRLNLPFRLFAAEYKLQEKALDTLDSTALEIIETKRKHQKENSSYEERESITNKKRTILIETLLQHPEMSSDDIHEEINNFLFAAYETTSTLVSFALYELAAHQDIQEKMYQDIIFQTKNDKDNLNVDTLQKMTYLDQVVKETLRLRPPLALIERIITEDAKFGNTVYPSGTVFTILIYWLQNSSFYFPDPTKFDPERFSPNNQDKRHPFAFVPFSAGPKNCIGQKYALLEVKTVLARIIMEFKVFLVEGSKMEIGVSGILKSKYGFPLKLQNRK